MACALGAAARTADKPVEVHQRLALQPGEHIAALTLDACGGGFDADLVATLIELRVPATLFLTRKWADKHPQALAQLRVHADLFELQDHGAEHVPAVMGRDARVYGLKAAGNVESLRREVEGGADAVARTGAPRPTWYRGATARYDAASLAEIGKLGYRVAGFSVNADAGATLPRRDIERRLLAVKPGDIVIAHMNKPAGETAEALRDVLPMLKARGITFVTLGARAVAPVDQARTS